MRRLTLAILVLLNSSSLLSCYPRSFHRPTSLTAESHSSGRWLVTVSVGGPNLSSDEILGLRNTLSTFFSSPGGGEYHHTLDLADSGQQRQAVTGAVFRDSILRIKSIVTDFRAAHPGVPTQIILGLTGHGVDADGRYTFGLSDGVLGGDELAKLIMDAGADETLVFLQSCMSGRFASDVVPSILGRGQAEARFGNELADAGRRFGRRVVVVTPVSSRLLSPARVWEGILGEILNRSGPGSWVSYGDFKDALVRRACSDDYYFPKEALTAADTGNFAPMKFAPIGIDPHFFEEISAQSPFYFTATGLRDFLAGRVALPEWRLLVPSRDVPVSSATQDFCRGAAAESAAAYGAGFSDYERLLRDGSLRQKAILLNTLLARNFSLQERGQLALRALDLGAPNIVAAYEAFGGSGLNLSRVPVGQYLVRDLQQSRGDLGAQRQILRGVNQFPLENIPPEALEPARNILATLLGPNAVEIEQFSLPIFAHLKDPRAGERTLEILAAPESPLSGAATRALLLLRSPEFLIRYLQLPAPRGRTDALPRLRMAQAFFRVNQGVALPPQGRQAIQSLVALLPPEERTQFQELMR